MNTKVLSGKEAASHVKENLVKRIERLKSAGNTPGLAVVLVGDDPASVIYVGSKKKACEKLGINSYEHRLSGATSQSELIALIERLNADQNVHGILVQLPLPEHLDEKEVIEKISQKKDVDCFHPYNVGNLVTVNSSLAPCTPAGVVRLLDYYEIPLQGKECVVIGRSNLVGKPLSLMLLAKNATVTVCHSRTEDLPAVVKRGDIVIAAVGKAGLVTSEMIKPGAVVVDVGINRQKDNKIAGDVDFESVSQIASAITPVPGGVGPMTIAMLMENVVICAEKLTNPTGAQLNVE